VRLPPLVTLLSLYAFSSTFSIGAFPTLLPELGAAAALADWQIGLVVGLLGFARMVADIPIGLVITHHLRSALTIAPILLMVGALFLVGGTSFGMLAVGRVVMGIGHALSVVSGLTVLLRFGPAASIGAALTAFEMSAMIGVLGGTLSVGLLPSQLPWNLALLIACSPQLLTFAVVPHVLAALPRDPAAGARLGASDAGAGGRRPVTAGVVLALAAGIATAVTYSTLEQFVIPLRGHREFGLDRHGIARLLMIAQATDVICLLPFGVFVDRCGVGRILGPTLIVFGLGTILVAVGAFPLVVAGCVLFGVGMAGWPLPLGLLRRETLSGQIGWRTAVYRVGVDGGIFLGPFLSGFLAAHTPRILPAMCATALIVIGGLILVRRSGRFTDR
jgi:MFS family permease